MAGSSPPPRRSHQWSSPQRPPILNDILTDDRNSEARHRSLLEAAKKEHDRVREEAERVYRDHLQREERQKLLKERKKEEERIRNEEQIAAERLRLLALKEKKVKIPEIPPTPTEPEAVKPLVLAATNPPSNIPPPQSKENSTPQPMPLANGNTTHSSLALTTTLPPVSGIFGAPKQPPGTQPAAPSPFSILKPEVPAQTAPVTQPPSIIAAGSDSSGVNTQVNGVKPTTVETTPTVASVDRYIVIHKNLKELRKSLVKQAKSNELLKARLGDMRRDIRKSVGQLTSGAGMNRAQQVKIVGALREALANNVASELIDPSDFVLEPRNPAPGHAQNNGPLPSLFLYLLNILSKAAISQFINEGGPRPETADPVGVCIAATFSEPDFYWRGAPLIDMLIAKFRVVCPVLFGYRGSEKTEQGRARLGWWKEGGRWVDENRHTDRMTGLGAGFAAVSLRKFAASKKENPYPPRHYWTALARIANTPPAEMTNTHYVVLGSMIRNYESKFIEFYGSAALAALKLCLVDIPASATVKSAAADSLVVTAQLLKKETGLVLG